MKAKAPRRVRCDFNSGDKAGAYWLLFYNDRPLGEQVAELGLAEGSEVVLYQDEDDFEVPAILKFGRTWGGEGKESWLAFPDWSRRVELS
jgi:hypothetical protein